VKTTSSVGDEVIALGTAVVNVGADSLVLVSRILLFRLGLLGGADEDSGGATWTFSVLVDIAEVADTLGLTVSMGVVLPAVLVDNGVMLDEFGPSVSFGLFEPFPMSAIRPGTRDMPVRIRMQVTAFFLFISYSFRGPWRHFPNIADF
jgi:hypothetical protein